MKLPLFALAIAALAAGCGGGAVRAADSDGFRSDERPIGRTLVYDCNGFEFVTRLGPGEMAVWLPDRYVVLSQARSGSGTRYVEGDVEFWSKGDEAMISFDGQQYMNCILQPGRVPWEDARRRGVDFRAVGNKPAWSLEIRNNDHLLMVLDDGMRRVLTPDPEVEDRGRDRSYHAVTDAADLSIDIIEGSCTDTLTGELFPSQVTVTLDGETYHGCGRDLDHPWE